MPFFFALRLARETIAESTLRVSSYMVTYHINLHVRIACKLPGRIRDFPNFEGRAALNGRRAGTRPLPGARRRLSKRNRDGVPRFPACCPHSQTSVSTTYGAARLEGSPAGPGLSFPSSREPQTKYALRGARKLAGEVAASDRYGTPVAECGPPPDRPLRRHFGE